MKAIETVYKGYRFRSRLEARWAVFFDALKIEWLYEHEGFELGSGLRYLPDFYLPESGIYVEVKPGGASDTELRKAKTLLQQTDSLVFITQGLPGAYGALVHHAADFTPDEQKIVRVSEAVLHFLSDGKPHFMLYVEGEEALREYWEIYFPNQKAVFLMSGRRRTVKPGTPTARAYDAARSARFEFGEAGA